MRYFFRRRIPPFNRVLLIESGSRDIIESLLPGLYDLYRDRMTLDLVTCYSGAPASFRPGQGRLYRVTEYAGRPGRKRLYRELGARGYDVIGIICSGEPIMTKWKWVLAARIRAKLFVLNENCDYFWVDYSQWRTMRHFAAFRTGLSGAGAAPTLARLLFFPLALLYLLAFAAAVHLRRRARA
ncbi:MAG: hypothetical protein HYZ57_10345 [Acidobacteria bacterium]|nr:hypothetical protein [Acidobacteriota bacterium]MBI3280228.1 hypothetical protein [Acidobacteriota bacterium]